MLTYDIRRVNVRFYDMIPWLACLDAVERNGQTVLMYVVNINNFTAVDFRLTFEKVVEMN